MPKQAESRHAPKLRELGFEPVDKKLTLAIRSELPRKLSRKERRQLRKMRYRPLFTMTDIMTNATDDTGLSWIGPANTDLSSLGFDNKTEEYKKNVAALRHSDPRYN